MPSFWESIPPLPPADDLERDRRWSVSNNNRNTPCIGVVQTLFLTVVWSFKLLSAKMQQYAADSGTDRTPPMAPQEPKHDTAFYEESSAPVDAQPIAYSLAHAASRRAGRLNTSRFLSMTGTVFDDSPFSLNQSLVSRESSFFAATSSGSRATSSPPVFEQPLAAAETVEEQRTRSSSISTPRPSVVTEQPSIV